MFDTASMLSGYSQHLLIIFWKPSRANVAMGETVGGGADKVWDSALLGSGARAGSSPGEACGTSDKILRHLLDLLV